MGEVARWTLIAVIVLLAFIGFLHLTRGTAVKHVRGVGADGAPVAVSEPEFPLSVAMLTGASLAIREPRRGGAKWRRTYERLWQDLRSARRSITLQLYYGHPGRMGDTLRDILIERTRAGVRVFLLYDAFRITGHSARPPVSLARQRCLRRGVPSTAPVDAAPVPESIARPRHRRRWPHRLDGRIRDR